MKDLVKELASFIDNQVQSKLSKYQAYINFISTGGQLFKNSNLSPLLVTGSEAKSYYGFTLYPNGHKIRDLDVVINHNGIRLGNNDDIFITDLMEVLQEATKPFITHYTGVCSSTPVFHEGEPNEFKKAIYHFYYQYKGDMRFVEVFEKHTETIGNRGYVDLATLVRGAKAWKRPKDLHFLEQVENLTKEQ
jgi:hypothetical protein